ncbi:MAG: septum formation initiator family protein [Coriobacteriales bacterium]|jgi:cell division protein FtsL|nr:septum formation initiator family protein [Coriobacteriales bacterium]
MPDPSERDGVPKKPRKPRRRPYRFAIIALFTVIVVVLATPSTFINLRDQYFAERELQRLNDKSAAEQRLNDEIKAQTDRLYTDEGIMDIARKEYNMTLPGEEAVNIPGLGTTSSTVEFTSEIVPGSDAPESNWQTDFLDTLFGYDATPPAKELNDPFIR